MPVGGTAIGVALRTEQIGCWAHELHGSAFVASFVKNAQLMMSQNHKNKGRIIGLERTHQDYAVDGLDATQVCCACGSGVIEASNVPFASQDSKLKLNVCHISLSKANKQQM